jgi:hypothetical protein
MELGIRLSFVKTSEFRGGGELNTPKPPLVTPLVKVALRCESFGEFHNLLDVLLKDEERFWRYFRMSSDTFKYILELIHTAIKKQNTNFLKVG